MSSTSYSPPEWSAEIVGLMHIHKISVFELAQHLGWRREYVSRLLNGAENRANAKELLTNAVSDLIKAKTSLTQ